MEWDDKVLLMRRSKLKGGNYGFVGGHVDPGETPLQAIIRETREEIGVKLSRKHLKLQKVVYRGKGDLQKVHIIFRTKRWKGTPETLEPRFCKHIGWYERKALPLDLSPAARAGLEGNGMYEE